MDLTAVLTKLYHSLNYIFLFFLALQNNFSHFQHNTIFLLSLFFSIPCKPLLILPAVFAEPFLKLAICNLPLDISLIHHSFLQIFSLFSLYLSHYKSFQLYWLLSLIHLQTHLSFPHKLLLLYHIFYTFALL